MNTKKNVERIHKLVPRALMIGLVLSLSACETVGPNAVRAGRTDYNTAIKFTNTEELLLNLVRLRFNDQPYVLGVSSISARVEFGGSVEGTLAESETAVNFTQGSNLKAGIKYIEKPTIVYQPLRGKEFARQLLTPIDLQTLLLLRNAGWDLDDILRVFTDRINEVPNAPTAATSTPEHVPDYRTFLEIVEAFDELEDAGKIVIAARRSSAKPPRSKQSTADGNESERSNQNTGSERKRRSRHDTSSTPPALLQELVVYVLGDTQDEDIVRLSKLLKLDPNKKVYRLKIGLLGGGGDTILINTRPLMSAMFYLGQSIKIPDELIANKTVNYIVDKNGKAFDWSNMFDGLFRIRSSSQPPANSYVAVEYEGHYYYIDGADVDSRETLTMLGMVLTLKAVVNGHKMN